MTSHWAIPLAVYIGGVLALMPGAVSLRNIENGAPAPLGVVLLFSLGWPFHFILGLAGILKVSGSVHKDQ